MFPENTGDFYTNEILQAFKNAFTNGISCQIYRVK